MTEEQTNYKTRKQTIFRTMKNEDNPFVMIDRRPIENPDLSWKAKGILTYLLSRPDNWIVRLGDLVKRSPDGVYAIRGAINELKNAGHVYTKEIRDEQGKFVRYELEVYELPFTSKPLIKNPQADNPQADNLTINDNNNNNTELNNIGANAPDLPLDWQIAIGRPISLQDDKQVQMIDSANMIDTGCPGAYELALAFMQAREIVLPIEKAKGQRKAAREMLQMGVRGEHVKQATESLIEKGMTIVDLFAVSKTAIDLANPKPETKGFNPQGLSVKA